MRLPSVLILVALALCTAGCDPAVPVDQYYGQLLPVGLVQSPPSTVAYVTAPGDTTWGISQRFYGKNSKVGAIEILNKGTLRWIRSSTGELQKGKILFLPADYLTRPLDPKTMNRYW